MPLNVWDLNIWELLGTITGFACVWFAARENVLTWPLGIVSALLYYKVFTDWKLYSDAWLQLLFAVFQIFGWFQWRKKESEDSVPVRRLKPLLWLPTVLVLIALWCLWYFMLVRIRPDANLPIWDSMTTVTSLLAVFLQARKAIECWWLWILADLVYVPMYISRELYFTAALYILFLILAVYGYISWYKSMGRAKLA